MAEPLLASPDDVADLWRPLSSAEQDRVDNLIGKASALLRQKMPAVDDRIARYAADPTDRGALNPVAVANVVATVVKRFLVNPDGATNTSETTGPYTYSKGFALRGDSDIRGELVVLDTDIAALTEASAARARLATVRTRPSLAPYRTGYDATEASVAAGSYDPGVSGWVTPDPGY